MPWKIIFTVFRIRIWAFKNKTNTTQQQQTEFFRVINVVLTFLCQVDKHLNRFSSVCLCLMLECLLSIEMSLWHTECIQLWDKCHNIVSFNGHKLLPLCQETKLPLTKDKKMLVSSCGFCLFYFLLLFFIFLFSNSLDIALPREYKKKSFHLSKIYSIQAVM